MKSIVPQTVWGFLLAGCLAQVGCIEEPVYPTIHDAAGRGDTRLVRAFLEDDASYANRALRYGGTPLRAAIYSRGVTEADILSVVEALLEYGARVDAHDPYVGATPLHYAAKGGLAQVVGLLLSRGAEKDARDDNGETPMHYAARGDRARVIDVLIGAGGDPNPTSKLERRVIRRVRGRVWAAGETPLHVAVAHHHVAAACALLAGGADPEVNQESYGIPAVGIAAIVGDVDTVRVLLKHGACRRVFTAVALDEAEPVVEVLEKHGGATGAVSRHGETLLHVAASCGSTSVAGVLLQHGANANATNRDRETPLHVAAARGRLKMVRLLLEAGARREAETILGQTAADYATRAGNTVIARFLLGVDN
jgi:ankyrin repeat protein